MLFYSSPNAWPTYGKTHKYWREAAEYVQLRSSTRVIRIGELIIIAVYNIMCISTCIFYFIVGACRLRVVSKYPRLFPTPADAERHYWGRGIEAVEAEPQEPFVEAGTRQRVWWHPMSLRRHLMFWWMLPHRVMKLTLSNDTILPRRLWS